MTTRRPGLSLKGRGLALLAQRDHSRIELKRKLMRHARAEVEQARASEHRGGGDGPRSDANANTDADADADSDADPVALVPAADRVAEVLDWLEAHRYLNEARFTESRVHARAPKFGNLRIRHELSQHGVTLTPEALQQLAQTELERAREVRQRKFDTPPANASEQARQARFLAARGFSADVVGRLMRQVGRTVPARSVGDIENDDGEGG